MHAEGRTTAAVILMAELYKKPIHVCHVARKEEVSGQRSYWQDLIEWICCE